MSETTKIHDTFFRETMSHKEVAADFLTNYLPDKVLEHIRLDTLREHYAFLKIALKTFRVVLLVHPDRVSSPGYACLTELDIVRRTIAKRINRAILS